MNNKLADSKERQEFVKNVMSLIKEISKTESQNVSKEASRDPIGYYTYHSEKEIKSIVTLVASKMEENYFNPVKTNWVTQIKMQNALANEIIILSAKRPPEKKLDISNISDFFSKIFLIFKNIFENKEKFKPEEKEVMSNKVKKGLSEFIEKDEKFRIENKKKIREAKNSLKQDSSEDKKNNQKISLEDLLKIDINFKDKDAQDNYIKTWKNYLNKIISDGKLISTYSKNVSKIPYLEKYIKAKEALKNIEKKSPEVIEKINAVSNILTIEKAKSELKETLDNEVKLITRLHNKEGYKKHKSGLNERQIQALKWMSNAEKGIELTDNQREFVQIFIKNSFGDMKLNKALKNFEDGKFEIEGISNDIYKDIMYISYKTQYINEFKKIYDKFEQNYKNFEESKKSEFNNKITFEECHVIKNLCDCINILEKLDKYSLLKGNKELEEFYKEISWVKKSIVNIEKIIMAENNLESGDLISYDMKKHKIITSKKEGIKEKLTYSLVKHNHTGKAFIKNEAGKNKEAKISHLYPKISEDKYDIFKHLFSTTHKICAKNVIKDQKIINKLEEKYGENWGEEINKFYREIEHNIQNKVAENFKGTKSSEKIREIKAGIAEIIPGGHKRYIERDLNKLYKKIFVEGKYKQNNRMLCSEFAAKTTIVAFIELEIKLKQELGIENPDIHIIDLSFISREKLSKIHPDRLISFLEKAGCAIKIEPTETEKYFFKGIDKEKHTDKLQSTKMKEKNLGKG